MNYISIQSKYCPSETDDGVVRRSAMYDALISCKLLLQLTRRNMLSTASSEKSTEGSTSLNEQISTTLKDIIEQGYFLALDWWFILIFEHNNTFERYLFSIFKLLY